MTGTRDVTTCADIVYGKHFRTHLSQISLVSALLGACTWTPVLENGIRYRDSDFTIANGALQHGTNILISEICVKWSVFSDTVSHMSIVRLFTSQGKKSSAQAIVVAS